MQSLQGRAGDLSGLSQDDAFMIDQVNLFERLGKDVFVKLSTEFYTRVYSDSKEPWFAEIFKGSTIDDAIQNQYEFFIQVHKSFTACTYLSLCLL
jgi:truncated hemoglobin YjbI